MSTIIADSRRCGSGKTRDLYKTTLQAIDKGHQVILILPGIDQIKRFSDALRLIINAPIHTIHSDNTKFVADTAINHINEYKNEVIIISHMTMLNIDWTEFDLKNTCVYLDEEIDMYRSIILSMRDTYKDTMLNVEFTPTHHEKYTSVHFAKHINLEDNTFYKDNKFLHLIPNKSWLVHCHASLVEFKQKVIDNKEITTVPQFRLHAMFDLTVFSKAKEVIWLCADIEHSTMYLANKNHITFYVPSECSFEKHYNNITINTTNLTKWTCGYQKQDNPIGYAMKNAFITQWKKRINKTPSIFIDNIGSDDSNLETHIQKVKSNVHGSNEYELITNVGCFCTINYEQQTINYLNQMWNVPKDINEIRHTRLYYQTIFRGCARTNVNNVMTADIINASICNRLKHDYLPLAVINQVITFGEEQINRLDMKRIEKKEKTPPLTRAELSKVSYYKKNHPEYKDKNAREILNLIGGV